MSAPADALVLDFGGVITRTIFETHRDSERVLGLEPGTLTWRGPFDPESDLLWQSMQAGEITERDYWYEARERDGRRASAKSGTRCRNSCGVSGATIRSPRSVPRRSARSAAAKAARRRLAILSNELDLFYGAGFRAKLPFLEDFDLIVDATYTKILKPDPRAYAFVTDGLGLARPDAASSSTTRLRTSAAPKLPACKPSISTCARPTKAMQGRSPSSELNRKRRTRR